MPNYEDPPWGAPAGMWPQAPIQTMPGGQTTAPKLSMPGGQTTAPVLSMPGGPAGSPAPGLYAPLLAPPKYTAPDPWASSYQSLLRYRGEQEREFAKNMAKQQNIMAMSQAQAMHGPARGEAVNQLGWQSGSANARAATVGEIAARQAQYDAARLAQAQAQGWGSQYAETEAANAELNRAMLAQYDAAAARQQQMDLQQQSDTYETYGRLAAMAVPAAMLLLSDEREKKDIDDAHAASSWLRKVTPVRYEYRDSEDAADAAGMTPDWGEKRMLGVLAQDLAKTKEGRSMLVRRGDGSLAISPTAALGPILAALADHERRLRKDGR